MFGVSAQPLAQQLNKMSPLLELEVLLGGIRYVVGALSHLLLGDSV